MRILIICILIINTNICASNNDFNNQNNNNNVAKKLKRNRLRNELNALYETSGTVAPLLMKTNNDDVLLAGIENDEYATDVGVSRNEKRSSFLPNQQSSANRNYFRDLISRNPNNPDGGAVGGENTVEYTLDPSFSKYLLQKHRKQQSEIHGGTPSLQTREVHVKQGKLVGIVREMHIQSRLSNVDQFLGIPFAEAPTGSRRFMPPGTPLPWKNIKYANKLEKVCPQTLPNLSNPNGYNKGRYDQIKRLLPYLRDESEDCLYLNLYVPSWDDNSPPAKFPVIVYLHGESFAWNSGNPYDGSILASYGQVIVVTINYRLGVLGFMKPGLNDQTVSNFGLLDQIAALQWIKENIFAFRGDPKSVTLLGYDTGAVCVNFLMISPVAKGLFHRSILMSGSALADWALNHNPQDTTMQVAQKLNCPIEDDELGACLRNKTYEEILNVTVTVPEFLTIFGPISDGLVVPSNPHSVMAHSDLFSRYDLLFGMTELESYNILGRDGILQGLTQDDRDQNLKRYLSNRYEVRPEVAFLSAIKEYTTGYVRPGSSAAMNHRDTLLEILSDARVTAPTVQTGILLSRNNPKCYMYVFAHNSEAGENGGVAQSIHGEDLPYVFGAPLGQVGPFQSYYNVEERLFSEAVMKYFSNFAKTGDPKSPWREYFINMNRDDWQKYDVDWPEFNEFNQNYLHLGIPPIVSQRYHYKYTKFWNEGLEETMRAAASMNEQGVYGTPYTPATPRRNQPQMPAGQIINMYPIQVEIDGKTEDPLRELRYRLQHSKDPAARSGIPVTTESINFEQIGSDDSQVFKSESTTFMLVSVIVAFLLINVIGATVYLYRRNKKLHRKYDNSNIFDAVSEDKRSKFNDTDDSFILDVLRKSSNNTYESVKHHSPINGFAMTRQISTSTVDTHTKVSDWISSEISKYSPRNPQQISGNSFSKKNDKISIGIDATPQARSNSILRQEPIEITKAKSCDYGNNGKIICQEIDMDMSMIAEVPLRYSDEQRSGSSSSCSSFCDECANINHQHSYSDPVQSIYQSMGYQEETTSFIENDVNVTCCDEPELKNPLSPEESLRAIQKMNYPKVLPSYPEDMQFNKSMKRRSLPPQYYQIHNSLSRDGSKSRPNPPPRMSSTLGRRPSKSGTFMTAPIQAEEPPKVDEPVITSNTLIYGPLVPKSESIYMSMQKNRTLSRQNSMASSIGGNQEIPLAEEDSSTQTELPPPPEHLYAAVVKNSRVQQPQDGIYSITATSSSTMNKKQLLERQNSNSQSCSSSSSSSSDTQSSTGTIRKLN